MSHLHNYPCAYQLFRATLIIWRNHVEGDDDDGHTAYTHSLPDDDDGG